MPETRAVAPVISTILMVTVAIILASMLSVIILDFGEEVNESDQQRVFTDTSIKLGTEYRSWSGGGNATHPDIDHIQVVYHTGPVFQSDEIGSILIKWSGDDGDRGQLRFVNPSRFNNETEQQYHDSTVGDICTGNITAGGQLTFRMVHNEFQSNGATDPGDQNPETGEPFGVRYVESGSNSINVNGEPFFSVDGRYPVEYTGDRPIEPGDSVDILFLGSEDELIIARTSGTASEYQGTPTEPDDSDVSC